MNLSWPYPLRKGHSDNPAEGACAMDAVNWLVHGRHGDEPECACPVIGVYVIALNDGMPDQPRQRLLPYLSRIAGSRSEAHVDARVRILVLAAVRVFAPAALERCRMEDHAARLRALPDDASYTELENAAARAANCAENAWCPSAAWASRAAANAAMWGAETAGAMTAQIGETWGGNATRAAAESAVTQGKRANWNAALAALDAALRAGPQGEPWSADVMTAAVAKFDLATAS